MTPLSRENVRENNKNFIENNMRRKKVKKKIKKNIITNSKLSKSCYVKIIWTFFLIMKLLMRHYIYNMSHS